MPNTNKKQTSDLDQLQKQQIYSHRASTNRMVTRSQTGFLRIKHTPSNNNLFLDESCYHPEGLPHLMYAMKGKQGAMPSTIITRSASNQLGVTPELEEKLVKYKASSRSR